MLKRNVGKTDKIIRIAIGAIIATLGIVYQSWWGLLAIIPFATAFLGFCGLYTVCGANTCSTKEKP